MPRPGAGDPPGGRETPRLVELGDDVDLDVGLADVGLDAVLVELPRPRRR
jgi:hypothetical protein